jgi:hypothetical protein
MPSKLRQKARNPLRPTNGRCCIRPKPALRVGPFEPKAVLIVGIWVVLKAFRINVAFSVEWIGESVFERLRYVRALLEYNNFESCFA